MAGSLLEAPSSGRNVSPRKISSAASSLAGRSASLCSKELSPSCIHLNEEEASMLLGNIHEKLAPPGLEGAILAGKYDYYHYGCDGVDDRGWGCGYRTLQTICSWIKYQQEKFPKTPPLVPSLKEIQEALVAMDDKSSRFLGSKEWIGSVEVSLCLDYFYNVPGKIIHIPTGRDLADYVPELQKHFQLFGSPVMMGGDTDNSSKGILGICKSPDALLVLMYAPDQMPFGNYIRMRDNLAALCFHCQQQSLDPHFYGEAKQKEYLQDCGWIKWRTLDTFIDDSFYNLCLPQLEGR